MSDLGYDDFDDDTLDDQGSGQGDNSVIKTLRKAQREAAARAKAAEAKLAEMESWKAEQEAAARKAQVGAVAVQLGLTANQAALVPSDLEATREAVAAWAVAHDLLKPDAAPQDAAPQSFVPVTGPGGVAPDLTISRAEFNVMYANPATRARAESLFMAGRVNDLPTIVEQDENGVTFGKVPY